MWFNSEATFRPNNVASTEIIDRKTPNSEVCMANGYSSMVFDQRIFVSFNPCAHLFKMCLRMYSNVQLDTPAALSFMIQGTWCLLRIYPLPVPGSMCMWRSLR